MKKLSDIHNGLYSNVNIDKNILYSNFVKLVEQYNIKDLNDIDIYAFYSKLHESIGGKINEEENEYQKWFKEKLKEKGIKTPNELNDEEKAKFFDNIKKEWANKKGKTNEDVVINTNEASSYVKYNNYQYAFNCLRDESAVNKLYENLITNVNSEIEKNAIEYFKNQRILGLK